MEHSQGFPEQYDLFPRLRRAAEFAGRLTGRPQRTQLELSTHYTPEHFRTPETAENGSVAQVDSQSWYSEPTDGEAMEPVIDRARAVAHYVGMAAQARAEQ